MFNLSRLLLLHWFVLALVSPIWNIGHWSLVGYGTIVVAALIMSDWTVFYLSFTFLLMSLYWIVAPPVMSGLPILPLLFPSLLSSLLAFFVHRSDLSWIRLGKIDRFSMLFIVSTGILSTIALILWATWTDNFGAGEKMIKGFAAVPFWQLALIGIPLFSFMNALAEEIVYRGIIQEVLQKKLTSWMLVLFIQAATFSSLHYAMGFPNGKIGFAMVFIYGLALGFLRHRTRGMLAPYVAHVIADLTIGYFLILKIL